MGPEMLPLQVTCMGKLMETAEKLNVSIKKSFLFLVKISLVQSIANLGNQDLSYLIQLIEEESNIKTPAIEEQVIRRVTENPRPRTRQIPEDVSPEDVLLMTKYHQDKKH